MPTESHDSSSLGTVAVLSDDVARGRTLAQSLLHSDFQFVFPPIEACLRQPEGLLDSDVILLQVEQEPVNGRILRRIVETGGHCIVLLSHVASGMERATWIDAGAEDCLSYPCDRHELLARMRACVRRGGGQASRLQPLRLGSLLVCPRERRAEKAGQPLELTTCQFSLLFALARHAGEVLGRERLMEIAKGSAETAFERSIDVHVSRLRAKLHDDPKNPRMLKTVRGVGYVLVADSDAA